MSGSNTRVWAKTLLKIFIVVPICIAVSVAVLTTGFLLGSYMYFARDLPTVSELERYEPKVPCRVSNSPDGRKEWKSHCRDPEFPVDMDRLPPHVVNAFLAAEDASFFVHGLPSPAQTLYSHYSDVRNRGHVSWPQSRFTRMVAFRFLPRQHRSPGRLIRAKMLEFRIERIWPKNRILGVCLNEVFLGNECYGLGAGARRYFGKPAEQLSIAEAALIAGIVNSPSRCNSVSSLDKANERKGVVLKRMLTAGFLSHEEFRKAKEESLPIRQ